MNYDGPAMADQIIKLQARVKELETIIAQWQETWDKFTPMNVAKNEKIAKLQRAVNAMRMYCAGFYVGEAPESLLEALREIDKDKK